MTQADHAPHDNGTAYAPIDGMMQAPGQPGEDQSGSFAHGGWLAVHCDEAIGHQVAGVLAPPCGLRLGRRA